MTDSKKLSIVYSKSPNRYAIYTACVGAYDEIAQPKVVDDRFDYILFSSDVRQERLGVWQVRPIPYANSRNVRVARWVKTHPEVLLPDYTFTVWMDANMTILTHYIYEKSVGLFQEGCELASLVHPDRDCAYVEAITCSSIGFETERTAVKWMRKLWKQGWPLHAGLHETRLLYRANSERVRALDSLWWQCIDRYSHRDQLSFDYAAYRAGVRCDSLLPEGEDAVSGGRFACRSHRNETGGGKIMERNCTNYPFYYHFHNRYPDRTVWSREEYLLSIYRRFFSRPFPLWHCRLAGWRVFLVHSAHKAKRWLVGRVGRIKGN